jgi:branched-chain amino acid transport system ATP-binding protein
MGLVLGICQRIYVLEFGNVIVQGSTETIRTDPRVREAYLGVEVADEG